MLFGDVRLDGHPQEKESYGSGRTLVLLPGTPGKDLKQLQVPVVFGRRVGGSQGLDGRGFEQLGEHVGVRAGGGIGDDIGDEAGRGGAVGVG